MHEKLKIRKNNLLLLAGLVWGAAGWNILRIGLVAYQGRVVWWRILLSLLVYLAFQWFVFGKMVRKHTGRITRYEENRQYFYKFFDKKGFCIMAFMMTFGIGLRVSGLCPDVFIGVFYSGLGASLLTAGVLFLVNYSRECRQGPRETKHDEI